MELSDILIIFLLLSSMLIWGINMNKQCPIITEPDPVIIYKFRPDLDLQFDSTNFPSTIYTDMFSGKNLTVGGMSNDHGQNSRKVIK